MRLTLCTTLLLLSFGLSGCFGGDDDPGTGTTVGGDVGGDGGDLDNLTDDAANLTGSVSVALDQVPDSILAGQNVSFAWSLDGGSGNGTTVTTGIAWSTTAIANASMPAEAENDIVVAENATVPGTFDANVSFDGTGEFFVRAYALMDGNVTWSDEVNITVEAELVVKEVAISNAAVAHMASFSPGTVTIKVGEAVAWKNGDNEAHHIVSVSGSVIDTGEIAAGATSEPVVFDTAGTYEYKCRLHDGMGVQHDGTVVVEA